ncbi:MAG: response regulator [Planctomycetota bacterium]
MSQSGNNGGERLLRTDSEQKAEPKAQVDAKGASGTEKVRASVLVIDNDPLMLTAMGSILDMQGHRAVMARTEAIAIEQIQEGQFDVIVLSIDKLESGCEFAKRLRGFETTQDIPVIFLIPENSKDWGDELAKQGGVFSMQQPIDPEHLTELVDKALWMPHVARSRAGSSQAHMSRQSDWVKL